MILRFIAVAASLFPLLLFSQPRSKYIGQVLTQRTFYSGSKLRYDQQGRLLDPASQCSWTLCAKIRIKDVQADGANLKIMCQEFGGLFSTHVTCDLSAGAVITVRPGAFKTAEPVPLSGVILDKSIDLPGLSSRRRYIDTVTAPAGDIDITKYDILVSVGRGIQKPENIPIAEELAEALGAAVSCSRPVVDAKWLEKSRQVGSSGATVKPKVYLACGISGQFQHLVGLKGSPFIIAINKNPHAPIFQVADVGVVADILEFLPELTNKVRELKADRTTVGAR